MSVKQFCSHRCWWIAILCFLAVFSPLFAQKHFSKPYRKELATEVAFWKRVFTQVSQDEYIIHDADRLDLIYQEIRFAPGVGERQRQRRIKKIKKRIRDLLRRFHSGQVNLNSLGAWEKEIYHKFDHINEKDKFYRASKRIRAQQGIRENFMAGVTRSFAYLPYIRRIFQEYDLPEELCYLPHMESSFNPSAYSHVGAAGMWQFMRSTARRYMKVNRVKDERLDPLIATRAAARLLKYNYERLKDWTLAITAYNHGLGSMRKAKRRYGNYLAIRERYLRRSFGFASKNFYPEFLAVIEIADSLEQYFPDIEKDPVMVFQEIKLPRSVKLNRFVRQFGLDMAEFKRLNPGFRSRVWKGKRRVPVKYSLRLPLKADAQHILAVLGSGKDDQEKVTLALRSSDRRDVFVQELKQMNLRKAHFKRLLAEQQDRVLPEKLAVSISNEEYHPRQPVLPLIAYRDLKQTSHTREVAPIAKTAVAEDAARPLLAIRLPVNPAPSENIPFESDHIVGAANAAGPLLWNRKPAVVTAEIPTRWFAEIVWPEKGNQEQNLVQIEREISFSKAGLEVPEPVSNPEWQLLESLEKPDDYRSSGTVAFDWADQKVGIARPEQGNSTAPTEIFYAFREILQDEEFVAYTEPRASASSPLKPLVDARPDEFAAVRAPEPFPTTARVVWKENDTGVAQAGFSASPFNQPHTQWNSVQNIFADYPGLFQQLRSRLTVQNGQVTVFPGETLGHFSEWTGTPIREIRRLNRLSRREKIYSGQSLYLPIHKTNRSAFLEARLAYHLKAIQTILGDRGKIRLIEHRVTRGENLWKIAHKRYNFPVNLLLYFNDLNKLEQLYPGDMLKLPIVYN